MNKTKGRGFIKFVSAFCAFGFAITSSVFADTLGSWVIPGSGSPTTISSSANLQGVTVGPMGCTAGTTSTGTPGSTPLGATSNGWGGSNFSTSATVSASASKNFNFSVSATAGYDVVINGVSNFRVNSSSSGPNVLTLFYSTSSTFATSTQIAQVSGVFNTTQTLDMTEVVTTALTAQPITVRAGTAVYFRLVGTSAVSSGGTGRIPIGTVSVLGTVSTASAPSLVWGGAVTGVWDYDINNLAWLAGSTSVAYSSGAMAMISSASTLTIAPTGVDAGAVTNSISSGTTTLTGGALTAGTLMKSGGGTLVFSNTVGVNNSINAVNLSGGTLVLQGGGTNRIGTPSLLMAAGSTFDLGDTDQNVTDFNGSGTVVMTNMGPSAADLTRIVPINDFKATPSTPSTFSGQITGTGSFRLGGGTLTLEGDNTYTGQTVMNGTGAILYIWGQSNIPAQTAFDPLVDGLPNGEQYATDLRFANTSTLAIKDVAGTPNNVVLNRSIGVTNPSVTPTFWGGSDPASSLELAGPIKTLGSITIANASSTSYGTVILSGANPSITGVKVSSYGKLKFNGQNNLGGAAITVSGGDTTPYLALANGSLSNVTVTNLMSLASSTRLNVSVGTYTVIGPIGEGSDNKVLKWNGVISGAGCLLATNPGTLVLGAANSYTGGTQLRGGATLLVSAQNQLPSWTLGSTTSQDADLRFSIGGGTFGLDDSAGPTNVVLTNSFYAAAEGTFMAGTQTNGSSLTLAGPISGTDNIVASNSVTNAGTLILKGTNTFAGRLQVASRARVYVVEQANIANQIYLSDLTGYGRFGLDASAADSVTLTNAILVGITADNIIGTFNPGTNATTGGNRALHLGGVISGSGRVRVAEGGDLCLDNSANTYTNLTRIGTGRILFGSDGALGGPSTPDSLYGRIRFETAANSYLVATNSVTLNAGRTILIQSNNTANLDSQANVFTVAGVVQDEVPGEPGSVNKLGSGEVVLSGTLTYSGNTTVSAGKLTLKQINSSNESSTVSIVAGANLNLDFVGSDTVDKLYLNGVQSDAGTYNSTNSDGAIIGTGSLVVTSSPVIANTVPVITAAQGFSVTENASLGAVVGTVAATDADANSTLSGWTIVSGNTGSAFAIHAETGQITLAGALNYEATPSYSLGVTVSDGTATSAVGTVVITVTNIAEYSDVFGSSNPTADDNGDGISNLMAYALGAASPSSLVAPPTLNTSDPTKLTITALIRINDPKLNVVGEYGTSLGTWVTESPIPGIESSNQAGVVAGVTQRQDFSVPRETDPKKFLHLKATLQP
jgi:autotransporter-associated beta strand protein